MSTHTHVPSPFPPCFSFLLRYYSGPITSQSPQGRGGSWRAYWRAKGRCIPMHALGQASLPRHPLYTIRRGQGRSYENLTYLQTVNLWNSQYRFYSTTQYSTLHLYSVPIAHQNTPHSTPHTVYLQPIILDRRVCRFSASLCTSPILSSTKVRYTSPTNEYFHL